MSPVPNGDSRDSKAGRGEAGREEEGREGRQEAVSHIKAIGAVIRNDGQQLQSPCSALSASLCSLGDPLCLPTWASPFPGSSISPDMPLPEAAPSQIRSAPGPCVGAADAERAHHPSCPLTSPAPDATVPLRRLSLAPLIYAVTSKGHTWPAASSTVTFWGHECGYLPPVK